MSPIAGAGEIARSPLETFRQFIREQFREMLNPDYQSNSLLGRFRQEVRLRAEQAMRASRPRLDPNAGEGVDVLV